MSSITLVVAPEPTRVRLLARQHGRDVLKAVLGPAKAAHPRAAATFLEGLALWHQQSLDVVLCVDDRFDGCTLGLCDALGFGARNLHYEIGIAQLSARHRTLTGIGDFSDLRRLDVSEVRP